MRDALSQGPGSISKHLVIFDFTGYSLVDWKMVRVLPVHGRSIKTGFILSGHTVYALRADNMFYTKKKSDCDLRTPRVKLP